MSDQEILIAVAEVVDTSNRDKSSYDRELDKGLHL